MCKSYVGNMLTPPFILNLMPSISTAFLFDKITSEVNNIFLFKGSRPESAGSNTKVTKSQRARGNAFFTSTDENKKPSGLLRPTKASLLKAQGKGKVVKREKEVYSESQQEEINWVSAGVLASMEYNGSLNGSVTSRRTSNSSTEIKESIGKTRSRENKPIRRTRWL